MDHADEVTKEAVKQGDLSINQAYQKTQEKRKKTASKRKKTNAKESAPNGVQEVCGIADEEMASTAFRPVFLSLEQFSAMQALGGCIEEHVAYAIELYLRSLQNQCEQTTTEDAPEEIGRAHV